MPWLDDHDILRRKYDLEEFCAASEGLAVDAMVYLQVDVTPAYGLLEARWAAARAERDSRLAAIVAFAPIEDGQVVRTYLDELVRVSPLIHGVRRLLQAEAADFGIQTDFIRGLRALPAYGLSFDICIKHHQLACAIQMVRACPETSFILDHIGKPDIRAQQLDPWRDQLSELASLPNVVCKVSGLVTEAELRHWSAQDLAPYVSHVLEAFGEDRVLFGGDWPVVTMASSYKRWVQTLAELTQTLSPTAAHKLWSANAQRVYRL